MRVSECDRERQGKREHLYDRQNRTIWTSEAGVLYSSLARHNAVWIWRERPRKRINEWMRKTRERDQRRTRERARERGVSARLRRDNNNTAYKTIRYYTSYSPTLKRDTNLIYIRALGVAARQLTTLIKRGVIVGHFGDNTGEKGRWWTLRARYWLIFWSPPNERGITITDTQQGIMCLHWQRTMNRFDLTDSTVYMCYLLHIWCTGTTGSLWPVYSCISHWF